MGSLTYWLSVLAQKLEVLADEIPRPKDRKGSYVVIHHYISNGKFPALLVNNPELDRDGYFVNFVARSEGKEFTTSTGFWGSAAVYLPDEEVWEVADGGYADGEEVEKPSNWRVPARIRRQARGR